MAKVLKISKAFPWPSLSQVGKMPNLGTTAPSKVMLQQNPDGAQSVRVNDHIGELTAPAVDD